MQGKTMYFLKNWKMICKLLCYRLVKVVLVVFAVNPVHISGRYKDGDNEIENYMSMELQFLTSVNESKLHLHDYHVANIHLQNESYFVMHISKPDIFSLIDEESNHEMDQLHCVYSGTITSSTGNSVGMASLSSCNHENAFEGLISINNQHYHVTPEQDPHHFMHMVDHLRIKRSAKPHSFKYKVAPTIRYSTTGKFRQRDTVNVPIGELAKARQQMVKDQEGLEDEEDSDDSGEENTNFDSVQMQTLSHQNADDNTFQSLEMKYASRIQNPQFRNRNRGVKASAQRPAKVIELALFTDASLYRLWKAKYPAKAEAKIKEYLLTLVNNMNYVYKQPSLQEKISFRLVHVGIQKETPRGLTPTTNSANYLDSFCKFQGRSDANGALWDHGMMITAMNLLDDDVGSDGPIGLAYGSTMCLRYYSCSLIQYTKGFETAFTATHEIGHSLGMDHDGEARNKKCNAGKFIMAAVAGSGQINWSACSVANMKNFLKSGDSSPRVKQPTAIPRCLTKRGRSKAAVNYRRTAKFPGKKFIVKTQCQTACTGCTPVRNNRAPYNNICSMLHCQTQSSEIIAAHPALEGTSCGNGRKMCRNGRCQ